MLFFTGSDASVCALNFANTSYLVQMDAHIDSPAFLDDSFSMKSYSMPRVSPAGFISAKEPLPSFPTAIHYSKGNWRSAG